MPANHQLLTAILQQPEDDAPRLAYADAIASADNVRCAFIRYQIQLSHCEPDDPDRVMLYTESEELLRKKEASWVGDVGSLVEDFTFNRGFIERVSVSAESFLQHADTIFSSNPILHLDITRTEQSLEEFLASPHLRKIVSISFDHCGIETDEIRMLMGAENLQQIRWLSLSGNNIRYAGAALLARSKDFSRLRYANFEDNPVDLAERYEVDQGVILESWLPEDAERLEQEYGPQSWLRSGAETTRELPPNRFRL